MRTAYVNDKKDKEPKKNYGDEERKDCGRRNRK